ncbi:MAG: hypothetical protein M3O36_18355 [Myxococcota bacterium]|nr:hypothetical protein [Myxococcota bacterium]
MSPIRCVVVLVSACFAPACNAERKQECDKLLAAMTPFEPQGSSGSALRRAAPPTPEEVERVKTEVAALNLQDQPLAIYAENYQKTLTVLASTLQLAATFSAPFGTEDVIHTKLAEARTDRDDVQRYCAQ